MRILWGTVLVAVAGLAIGCESTERESAAGPEAVEDAVTAPDDAVDTSTWSVETEADDALRAAGDLLARARRFSFHAEITEEVVLESGAKIDTSRAATVHVRRPDGLYVERVDAAGERRIWYDGKSAALLDVPSNLYVQEEATPPDLDAFIDHLVEALDVSVPLADVVVADPYAAFRDPALGGVHLGEALIRGTLCQHLGFGNGKIEWQLWVQADGPPLIRKAVINYRDERGAPRWEAYLSDWDLEDTFADAGFTFSAPAGSHRIELVQSDTDTDESE